MLRQSVSRQVLVTHTAGIHARPSLAIVNTARRFQAKVKLRYGTSEADANDILQVMSLGVPCGAEVALSAQGPDAQEAVDAVANLVADSFGMSDE